MKALAIAAALLAAACGTPCQGGCEFAAEPPAYQADAIAAIRAVYGMEGPVPPIVEVAAGDCAWGQRFTNPSGKCIYGFTESDGSRIWLISGDMYTLAHEILHVFLMQTAGDGDADHASPLWNTLLPPAFEAAKAIKLKYQRSRT